MHPRNNRFSTLAEDGDDEDSDAPAPPQPPPPVNARNAYSLTVGTQVLQNLHRSTTPNGASDAVITASFFGRCFQCQYMSHSQKFCPLRQCKLCHRHGHSEIACTRQKSNTPGPEARGFTRRANLAASSSVTGTGERLVSANATFAGGTLGAAFAEGAFAGAEGASDSDA